MDRARRLSMVRGALPAYFDGVVTIDGARGVILQGFTVQNSLGHGISGMRGAAFSVLNTTAQNNGICGLTLLQSSTAEISDFRVLANMDCGIDIATGSSAVLKGAIDVTGNPGGGVGINGTSILEMRGARVNVRNNGAGFTAGSNSQIAVFNAFGQPTTVTVDGNVNEGIALGDSVLNIFGQAAFTVS